MKPKAGTCRYCGCTQNQACYPPCSWLDEKRTICNSAGCANQAVRDGLAIKMRVGRKGTVTVARY